MHSPLLNLNRSSLRPDDHVRLLYDKGSFDCTIVVSFIYICKKKTFDSRNFLTYDGSEMDGVLDV